MYVGMGANIRAGFRGARGHGPGPLPVGAQPKL